MAAGSSPGRAAGVDAIAAAAAHAGSPGGVDRGRRRGRSGGADRPARRGREGLRRGRGGGAGLGSERMERAAVLPPLPQVLRAHRPGRPRLPRRRGPGGRRGLRLHPAAARDRACRWARRRRRRCLWAPTSRPARTARSSTSRILAFLGPLVTLLRGERAVDARHGRLASRSLARCGGARRPGTGHDGRDPPGVEAGPRSALARPARAARLVRGPARGRVRADRPPPRHHAAVGRLPARRPPGVGHRPARRHHLPVPAAVASRGLHAAHHPTRAGPGRRPSPARPCARTGRFRLWRMRDDLPVRRRLQPAHDRAVRLAVRRRAASGARSA